MGMRNTRTAWGWPHRLLHWAMAALILFMLGLGVYMTEFVTDTYAQFDLVQIHKSWGFVVFSLALVRLGWRWAQGAPDPLPMPRWQRRAAEGAHVALYALMLWMPLSGWLMASASELQDMYGIRNMVFGLFALPDPFVPGDSGLEEVFSAMHFWGAVALAALLAAHVAGALKHHFADRDATLARMALGERGVRRAGRGTTGTAEGRS
jgi:cytochrome b561